MIIVRNTTEFRLERPCILTIGTFDGVHFGHRKIIQQLNELKEKTGLPTVVLTFDPHPRKVIYPEQSDLQLLTCTDEKLELLDNQHIDITIVYPFTMEFAETSAQNYIETILVKQLKVKYLVIGYDHRFGSNREGNIGTLKASASNYNLEIIEISAKDIDDIVISSSKIRKAISEGKIELANKLLNYNYALQGTVIEGKKLGRTIGFPTANIKPICDEKLIPAKGVYFVKAVHLSKEYYGMMNVGTNPTVSNDISLKMEVNIFDFNDEIYGEVIKIEFLKFIRGETKFSDIESLKEQIQKDKKTCLELLA
ncbi:MAG: bifunctional riboflavin kinase/FAD synthetase [Bacteroidia bacterium]